MRNTKVTQFYCKAGVGIGKVYLTGQRGMRGESRTLAKRQKRTLYGPFRAEAIRGEFGIVDTYCP